MERAKVKRVRALSVVIALPVKAFNNAKIRICTHEHRSQNIFTCPPGGHFLCRNCEIAAALCQLVGKDGRP